MIEYYYRMNDGTDADTNAPLSSFSQWLIMSNNIISTTAIISTINYWLLLTHRSTGSSELTSTHSREKITCAPTTVNDIEILCFIRRTVSGVIAEDVRIVMKYLFLLLWSPFCRNIIRYQYVIVSRLVCNNSP